jgi:hypothetical protein
VLSTHSLGKTIPVTIQHRAENPVSAPWHCATYFCTANVSSPRRGTAEPSNGGECFFYYYTALHCDVRPAGTVFSVAVSPVRPSPPLQHHARHCGDTPMLLKRTGTGRRHACHFTSYDLPSTPPSSRHSHMPFAFHSDIGTCLNQYLWDLEDQPPLPPRL